MIFEDVYSIIKHDSDTEDDFVTLLNKKGKGSISWEELRNIIVYDPLYLSLSTDRQRKKCFDEWKQMHKTQDNNSELTFLKFVHYNYNPNLIYAIFRRRFWNSPEIKDLPIPEKTKENLFRQYVIYAKLSTNDQIEFINKHDIFKKLNK